MTAPVIAATIADALTETDRKALRSLPGGWSQSKLSAVATSSLAFNYGIPLIQLNGDWIKPSRVGSTVQRLLEQEPVAP